MREAGASASETRVPPRGLVRLVFNAWFKCAFFVFLLPVAPTFLFCDGLSLLVLR